MVEILEGAGRRSGVWERHGGGESGIIPPMSAPFDPMMSELECPFCGVPPERVMMSDELAVAIADKYPLTPGHALVVPGRHVVSLFEANDAEVAAMFGLARAVRARLADAPDPPDGLTVGVNDGAAAGQTVSHLHLHVIPRRTGDCPDPRGGLRRIFPDKAEWWKSQ